jgi:neutral ceramidase
VGPTVRSFHFFKDMQYWSFLGPNGETVMTCPAALGHAFGAGATDGPGERGFSQSDTTNPFWAFASSAIKTPSAKQKACQGVKPILLDIGEMDWPYAWGPNILDVQMFRVGQFIIIVAPTEATTMAGRRWRNAIANAAKSILPAGADPLVVLGGPANTYTHYTVTPEEYTVQRYEGASALYGQYTLYAHINLTLSGIKYLSPNSTDQPDPGPSPPDTRDQGVTFLTGVVYDGVPLGKQMGTCISQPADSYSIGATPSATFQGANPRNNLRLEGTFAAVEQQQPDGASTDKLTWETANDAAQPGTYRFKYYGDQKQAVTGKIVAFVGTSNPFRVV